MLLLAFSVGNCLVKKAAAESAGCGMQDALRFRGGSVYEKASLVEVNLNYVPPPRLMAAAKSQPRTFHQRPYTAVNAPTGSTGTRQAVVLEDIEYQESGVALRGGTHERQELLVETASLSFEHMYRPSTRPSHVTVLEFLTNLRQRNGPSITNTAIACLGVFVAWQIPAFHPLLQKWFVSSRSSPALAAVLSSLSHANLSHLLFNLAALFAVGGPVRHVLMQTQWPIWPLLLGSSVSGSLFHLALGTSRHVSGCMGLSDVTMALLAVYARIFPRQNLGIFLAGIIPVRMPASRLLSVVAAWSCVGCLLSRVRAPTTNVGHAAHLGGIAFGLAYYEAWIRRREWQPLLSNIIKPRR